MRKVATVGSNCYSTPKNLKNELQILYYNCRGLANEERLVEFERALEGIKWNIVGLTEVRRVGENLIKRKNGHYLYYFGETKGYRGTWFYIHKDIMNRVILVKSVCERISVIKIEVQNGVNMTLIQVYAPTLASEQTECEEFYKLVEETLHEYGEYYNLVMGDWHAKVGEERENVLVMGKYGIGDRNENGDKLVELASRNNLKIANTFFPKKFKLKWTWVSPDSKSTTS